jgi:hypothetical protein
LILTALSKYSSDFHTLAVLHPGLDIAGQAAVVRTDAQIEEGKVRLDGDRLFVLGDGQVVLCQGFQHIGVHAVDIHPLAGILRSIAWLMISLRLVPLLLVQQDLGIIGQCQRVGIIQLLGDAELPVPPRCKSPAPVGAVLNSSPHSSSG